MVPGDDDREHDDERIEGADDLPGERARIENEADSDAERPTRVERGNSRDGIGERRRMRRADVDVGERPQRVDETDAGEPRRGCRELPVDHDRNRRRRQKAVAETLEGRPRAAVEPDEERGREHEVADHVEDVHRIDQPRIAEKLVLQRLLPAQVGDALQRDDLARVRERERPVRPQESPQELVDLQASERDRDLGDAVVARDCVLHAAHRQNSTIAA
ncbi:MAG TPA: hypothetical protein VG652_09145 [Gaiellaceae bacterium]|nr:hypothetical protein [Gaiellaceae bacterium]